MRNTAACAMLATALALATPAPVAVFTDRQSACPLYNSGLARLAQGDDEGALRDFDGAVNSCSVDIRIDILVRAGDVYLRRLPFDAERTRTFLPRLRDYGDFGKARAFILSGRIRLADDPTSGEIENAINDFSQARALHADVASEALFYSGEARRLAGADQTALHEYREIIMLDPDSVWAARSLLGSARAYVALGDVESGLGSLQQFRRRFPTLPEAKIALDLSTILYRIHLRGPSEPIFSDSVPFDRPSGLSSGVALAVDSGERIVLAHNGGWVRFSQAGRELESDRLNEREHSIEAIAIFGKQTLAVARKGQITLEKDRKVHLELQVPRRDGPVMVKQIDALLVTPWGEWIFSDNNSGVYRLWKSKTSEPFVQIKASRLASNLRGDVAVLDSSTKTVRIFGRNKALLGTIPDAAIKPRVGVQSGIGEPVDMAFDALGNLYVLDARNNALHIFDPNFRQTGRFVFPQSGPMAVRGLKALALGASGRLYVLHDGNRLRAFW